MADPFSFAVGGVAQLGISYLFPSEGPRLKDLKVSASTYGAAIPLAYGTCRVAGNMIWATPIKEVKKKQSTLGKGGFVNEYTYFCTFAMAIAEGPIAAVRRIWADGTLIYDTTGQSQNINNTKYNFRVYLGTEDQQPDQTMIADKGAGNTPAYRGLAYILFDTLPIGDFGNRLPQITAEVLVEGAATQPSVIPFGGVNTSTGADIGIGVYNPAEAVVWDWSRGYFYLADGVGNFGQFLLSNGTFVRQVTSADINTNFPSDIAGHGFYSLLAKCSDGSLIVQIDGQGCLISPIAKLDPYTFEATLVYGNCDTNSNTAIALDPNNPTAGHGLVITYSTGLTCTDAVGAEWYFHQSRFYEVCLLPTATMTGVAGLGFLNGSYQDTNDANMSSCFAPRNADSSGAAVVYVHWSDKRTNASYITKVSSLAAPSNVYTGAYLLPIGAIWDQGTAGLVIFYNEGGQNFVAKWDEASNSIQWVTPLVEPPNHMDGASISLNNKISWVEAGQVFQIDTTDGTLVSNVLDPSLAQSGAPDYAAYLATNPAIYESFAGLSSQEKSQYQTPTVYAQAYYYSVGKGLGQSLPLYTAADGIGLPAPYATASSSCQCFNSINSTIGCSNGLNGIVKVGAGAGQTTLGSIVADLLTRGDLITGQFNLDQLYAVVIPGYGWASGTNVKSVLDELRRLFLFDLVEIDGNINGYMRALGTTGTGATVATIAEDVLGSSSDTNGDYWKETRIQDADLPAQVLLTYMNIEDDYESSTARTARVTNPQPTMYSNQQLAMEINIVMHPTDAKNQIAQVLYAQWGERTKHNSRLPWAYLALTPADLFYVTMNDGRTFNERMHQTEVGADLTIVTESMGQDAGAYVSNFVSDGGGNGIEQVISVPSPAVPIILNTPLLRDTDDSGGSFSRYYDGAANGSSNTFGGAGVYKSTNNQDYSSIDTITTDVEWGTVKGVIPPPRHGAFALDWETKITIYPASSTFELEGITEDELWAGANACVIGDEVLQFRDCIENPDKSWTISNLLRGRRGSEYACYTHQAGDRFVFLSNDTIDLQGDLIDARGQARFYKAVGNGLTLLNATVASITYEPRDLNPYAVADIRRAFVSGSVAQPGDITLSWSRRTRLGGNMQDGTGDVSLSEATEQYSVYLLASAFTGDASRGLPPSSYQRVYSVTSPTLTYPQADQTSDSYDAVLDTLYVVIYQLSAAVGLGFPSYRAITPDADY